MLSDTPFPLVKVSLESVPHTLLSTLYARVLETRRPGSIFKDPESVSAFERIDYDFAGVFGAPRYSVVPRIIKFDITIRNWLHLHPCGMVVSLGEGLDTQFYRVDNGKVRWTSIDLPEVAALRERLFAPMSRFQIIPMNVLDFSWMEKINPQDDVFFVAQGLLMYLTKDEVHSLLTGITKRFPCCQILFDFVPCWFSQSSMKGNLLYTPKFRQPPTPWGMDYCDAEATLRGWIPKLRSVTLQSYNCYTHGWPNLICALLQRVPFLKRYTRGIAHIQL